MDYARIYDQLIDKFRQTTPEGYTEEHHIVPRSLGGGDEAANLVRLPARYHFVAHLLLAKIHGGKLIYAAWRMLTAHHYTGKQYEWLQTMHARKKAEDMRGNQHGLKLRGKKRPDIAMRMLGNKWNLGRTHTAETRVKVAAANRKRKTTSEMAKKTWKTRRKNGNDKMTPETIAKLKASRGDMSGERNPMYGRKHSAETKAIMAAKASARMKGNQNTKGMRFKTIDGKRIRVA